MQTIKKQDVNLIFQSKKYKVDWFDLMVPPVFSNYKFKNKDKGQAMNLSSKITFVITTILMGLSANVMAETKIASQSDLAADPLPHPSAMLDVDAKDKGVLFPRMTQAQRDEIQNKAHGLIIYNTDTDCVNAYSVDRDPEWHDFCYAGRLLADITISPDEISKWDGTGVKAIEYDTEVVNVQPVGRPAKVWDTTNYIFTAPYPGLYRFLASYGQQGCKDPYAVTIAISKPDQSPPGTLETISAVSLAQSSITNDETSTKPVNEQNCASPLIVSIDSTVALETDQTIFIQGYNQQSAYDVSQAPWGLTNDMINRLKITYLAPKAPN